MKCAHSLLSVGIIATKTHVGLFYAAHGILGLSSSYKIWGSNVKLLEVEKKVLTGSQGNRGKGSSGGRRWLGSMTTWWQKLQGKRQ